ncbi:unnamed protein product [Ambrosiozyma monospora]|uniref:Unnamed protein product n=1 Tax=Ambrosiozyma monospora TaxID=43982 RepID=A0ACB5STC0_AMBMO|nr:unnamed protein product [Ambrosiozyma monospora]
MYSPRSGSTLTKNETTTAITMDVKAMMGNQTSSLYLLKKDLFFRALVSGKRFDSDSSASLNKGWVSLLDMLLLLFLLMLLCESIWKR